MTLYIIAFMILASTGLIVYSFWPKSGDGDDAAIRRRISGRNTSSVDESAIIRKQAKQNVTNKVVKRFAAQAMKPIMPKNAADMSKLRLKLSNAGFRQDNAATMFLASKTFVAASSGVIAGLYAWTSGDTLGGGAGLVVFCTAAGFMAPNLWLMMATSKRMEQIRYGLPDSLDLMVISVEAGLALDAALQRVGDEMHSVHPILSEEFQIVALESQMGIPRAEALTNMANRTGVPEVQSLISIINQAERFGTSISRALRIQADTLRGKRRMAAEERAQKTTVKLMLPLILFIFPAILVVLGGPAALKMMETMKNTPGLL